MILVRIEHGLSDLDSGALLTGEAVVWLDARAALTDGGDVVEIAGGRAAPVCYSIRVAEPAHAAFSASAFLLLIVRDAGL